MLDAGTTKGINGNGNGNGHAAPKGTLPLVTREPMQKSVVWVGDVPIGGSEAVVMAGPCSVETREQVTATALSVKRRAAVILRGGAYKPRTSPYHFQGLGVQ